MRRLGFSIILAAFLLTMIVFALSNGDPQTFGYPMVFKFNVPFLNFESYTNPIQVGYVVMIAFCLGMITTPFLEALPSLYKSLELRAKNKRIRQLERELTMVREMVLSQDLARHGAREPNPVTSSSVTEIPPTLERRDSGQ